MHGQNKKGETIYSDARFVKSSFCAGGECVMIAKLGDGTVLIRDSKDKFSRTLRFTRSEWLAFVRGVKNREFDVE